MSTEAEDAVRRRTAVADYRKRLLQHKELDSRVRAGQIHSQTLIPLLQLTQGLPKLACFSFVRFARVSILIFKLSDSILFLFDVVLGAFCCVMHMVFAAIN